MPDDAKKMLVNISSYAGARPDYVQGGGGNTSVKFDGTLMGIKASGYTLAEITPDRGYVTVDYPSIRAYYESVDAREDRDFEKDSLEVSLSSIRLLPGMENRRPSVEAGFHSFLGRCVIHTHSVYANVLCCSEEGRALAQRIFGASGLSWLFVPYVDPGFKLTLKIRHEVAAYREAHGVEPGLIFLENHGMIAYADTDAAAIALHETANNMIQQALNIPEYPVPRIQAAKQGFISATPYLKQTMDALGADEAYLRSLKLYPDQLVYIGDRIGDTVRLTADGVAYNMGEREAQTVEETLLSVVFVLDAIRRAGLTLRQMREKDAAFIGNWESEKYRARLIRQGGTV